MKINLCSIASVCVLLVSSLAFAQDPAATSVMDVLKKDVGTWDAKIKMWMGPGEPTESIGTETNKMIGDFWIVSDFSGDMMGAPFTGHGVSGYDEKTKKITGTWVDSMSPFPMKMTGSYDAASKTCSYDTDGMDPTGNPMKGKMTVVHKADGTHVMTMFGPSPEDGKMMKQMEIHYTKHK